MNISYVIPVLNGEKYIHRCLESIVAEAAPQDEVIVIDNGSTDNTTRIVKSFDQVRLLVYLKITVAAVRNRGAKASRNELLAFIDSDCILGKGWRRRVIEVMKDETVHATGAKCEVPGNAGWIEKAWFSQKSEKRRVAKYLNTANLIVRRDVFIDLDGFDEALVTDEDCEFGGRLNKAGYCMVEDPSIRVIHLGNPTTLRAFYLRERWHATSVLASRSRDMMNLPTIMSSLFGVSMVLGFIAVIAAFVADIRFLWLVLLVLVIPLMTALYRAAQFGKFRYVLPLTLLWGIFFIARISNMTKYFSRH